MQANLAERLARVRRLDLPTLRAALWTFRAVGITRRQLDKRGLDALELPTVPRLPPEAGRAVGAVLRRRQATCLVSATVRQAWHAAQGHSRDLMIGVTTPGSGFHAHAWLEGDPPCHEDAFHELIRRPAKL